MDDVRKGRIALAFLKHMLREKGIQLTPDFRQRVDDIAKATGIPADEAMEFAKDVVGEVLEEIFAKPGKRRGWSASSQNEG